VQIKDFRTMDKVKLEKLMRENRKAWEVYNWLKENSDRFEQPILGPVCLEISVADRESAAFVEMSLSRNEKFAFITQTDGDYDRVQKLAQNMAHGHAVKEATFFRHLRTDVLGEEIQGVSAAQLKEYSINGTLISRVQASNRIKSWLTVEKNFHRKPIGSRDTFAKMTQLASDPNLTTTLGNGKKMHKLAQVVTPEYVIQISYSHYGNKAQSATSYQTR
jgi:hypothetical protein